MENVHRFRRKRIRQSRAQRANTLRSRLAFFGSILLVTFAIGAVAFGIATFVVYRSYADDLKPPEEAIAENSFGQSVAYDRTGTVQLFEYVDEFGGLRDPVALTEMSPYLIAATIATEDSTFYHNPGVNFSGVARAAWENLTPFGPGFLEGSGGSSITQQLVKNVYIQKDAQGLAPRTVERKIKETVIALELKRNYDDNQILEWYLNQIFYGRQAYGAEAAAEQFFGKPAKDLTLPEAALLAGLPQAPSNYDPDYYPEVTISRQNQVFDLMIEHLDEINDIKSPADPSLPLLTLTAEQIEAARAEVITYAEQSTQILTPHFVYFVKDQVTKMCQAGLFAAPSGIPCDKVVTQGGLRITTTVELGLQDIGQRIVEETVAANEERYLGHNGSLVAIRPGTGEILTYVGSRDFNRADIAGQVDIATSEQSAGSTMKVYTYLTGFEQGWVPSTFIEDAPLFLDTGQGQHQVNNWNFAHQGNITVRKALAESVNTAAVRAVLGVGIDEMRDLAHRLGITDLRQSDCGPTITLGSCEIKLVDHVFAYATIDNNGVMKGRPTSEDLPDGYRELDPVSVLKIEDANANIVYQFSTPDERQVVDPAYAYMITDILSNDAINWSRLTIDRPAASKTGTSEEFRDGVLMGYTPDLVTGVWMGNADNTPMAPGTFSAAGPGPIWRQFMQEAHAYLQLPPRPFEPPPEVVKGPCGGKQEVFKIGEEPGEPGACRAPTSPGQTPVPTPPGPSFPVRNTPRPTATPTSAPTPTPTREPVPAFYTVEEGDTLTSIAEQFGIPLFALLVVNDLEEEDVIVPGQTLIIPSVGEEEDEN